MTASILARSEKSVKPTEEHWRWVPGFEGSYEVSTCGNVRSRKTGHCHMMKKKYNRKTGYEYVILFSPGKSKTVSVHRLVALAFIPNPNGYDTVNHRDECKTNNAVENLEWCSQAYNSMYSSHKRRKRVIMKSLDGDVVAEFPSLESAATVTGLSKSAISQVANGIHMSAGGFSFEYMDGDAA